MEQTLRLLIHSGLDATSVDFLGCDGEARHTHDPRSRLRFFVEVLKPLCLSLSLSQILTRFFVNSGRYTSAGDERVARVGAAARDAVHGLERDRRKAHALSLSRTLSLQFSFLRRIGRATSRERERGPLVAFWPTIST